MNFQLRAEANKQSYYSLIFFQKKKLLVELIISTATWQLQPGEEDHVIKQWDRSITLSARPGWESPEAR